MQVQPSFIAGTLLALTLGVASSASAEPAAVVNVSVDGASSGTELRSVWPFFGFDEINYTTSPEGRQLLGALAAANQSPVHVRRHFLFNTGAGTPALNGAPPTSTRRTARVTRSTAGHSLTGSWT